MLSFQRLTQSGGTFTATSGTMQLGQTSTNGGTYYPLTITGGTFEHNDGIIDFNGGATGSLGYQMSTNTINVPADTHMYKVFIETNGVKTEKILLQQVII